MLSCNLFPVLRVPAVVVSGVLRREQLPVGCQWSWMPCCGFASQLTRELCVSHPPGWDPWLHLAHRAPGLAQHPPPPTPGFRQDPRGCRKTGISADRSGSPLWLCPPGTLDSSEDTSLSLGSISWLSLSQPAGVVKPSLFDTPAFLRGRIGADGAGVRAGCATAARQLCVRRFLLPGCQAAL